MENIVLIGMMGCGKTTISKLLSQRLNRPLIDVDEYLEDKYKMSIPQMFEISENYFREKETVCCEEIGIKDGLIVSTGGGVILNRMNIIALRQNGILFYIERPIENILRDIDTSSRPLLKEGPEKLYTLYQERHPLYLEASDYHILNHSSLEDTVNQIINIVKSHENT